MFKQLLPAFAKLRNQSKKSRQRRNRLACRGWALPEALESRRLLAVDPLGFLTTDQRRLNPDLSFRMPRDLFE